MHALHEIETGLVTVSIVRGFGKRTSMPPHAGLGLGETEMAKLETVVPEVLLQRVVETVQELAATGRPGDGKVFISRAEKPSRFAQARAARPPLVGLYPRVG